MSDWMLWGRYGGSPQLGSAPPPRLYLVPLMASVADEGSLAEQLGHRNKADRKLEDVTRALDRAVAGEFDGVIFPSSFLTLPFRYEVIERCRTRGLRIVHQVPLEAVLPSLAAVPEQIERAATKLAELMRRLDAGDALNLVFGDSLSPTDSLLARLTRWPEQVYFTFSVRKSDHVIETLHRLQPFVRERLFFHFPFHLEPGDGHLSCHKVFALIELIRSRVPNVEVRPLYGCELFDPRVDPTLELEPQHRPRLEQNVPGSNRPEISVVIPSYNNRPYLLNTLKHLSRQNLAAELYEVIVVDDGSTDGSEAAIRDWLGKGTNAFNLKYIYSPRAKQRKMGDANYRAGISRNLGVKHAAGRLLCFLDSDILTSPAFLADLIEKHRHYDVIQCKRLNLVQEKSDENIDFASVDSTRDTFFTEGGYWERFYSFTDWQAQPFFWKYTCTYGLSMPTKLFKRVGWIKRGFVFYGFEDVELGYRLARVGARFHLNDQVTYHLFHRNERSEFYNSDYLRQSLLAKTAQIFFLNLLEPDVFAHFRGLMREQHSLATLVRYGLDRLGLWKPLVRLTERWGLHTDRMQQRTRALGAALTKPFLAVWNWRWFLWHHWGRIKSRLWIAKMPLIWTGVGLRRIGVRVDHHLAAARQGWLRIQGQFWRLRVAVIRLSTGLQLWRVPVLTRAVIARLQLWRVPVFTRALIARLQLWRVPVFTRALIARLQLWRVPVFTRALIARLQLWRIGVWLENSLKALPLWRVQIFIARIWGERWRVQTAAARLTTGTVRCLQRIWSELYWRSKVVPGKIAAGLQLWRLPIAAKRVWGERWRLESFLQRTIDRAALWRIPVFCQRLTSQTWRLRVWVQQILSSGWRVRVATLRLSGAMRLLGGQLRQMLWEASYPFRKIFYFTAYQVSRRLSGKTEEPS